MRELNHAQDPRDAPRQNRLPLAAWAIAGVVTLFSLMSTAASVPMLLPSRHAAGRAGRMQPQSAVASGESLSDGKGVRRPARPVLGSPRRTRPDPIKRDCRILRACALGLARTLRLYPPPMNLITRTDELAEACAKLGTAPFVAVDTEFMREQTFWPRLCLIQIAANGTEALVDSSRARPRPRAVLRADGQRARAQSVSFGAAGH